MGNKSYRINTTAGGSDKYIKFKLEQDVDSIEILSLNIKQKDIYSSFNANFGVLIGRVIANGGVGIPNAKISIFIPLSEDDKLNSDITAIYPYETPRDKNVDGVRYNLLPRVAINNPFLVEGDYAPNVPVGTFPTKEEISVNPSFNETYKKYYKYTTVTNLSGDYMIYGAPIGSQTVHMSVDVTDIGKYSMNPTTMIKKLGYSPNLFTENGTKIKFSTDLETLPNVETQEVSVDVKPFWGDVENYEIGITRQDFKIRAVLTSSFIVFGSNFTDNLTGTWGQNGFSNSDHDYEFYDINGATLSGQTDNVGIHKKRIGLMNTSVWTIPNRIPTTAITASNFSTKYDVIKLDQSEYAEFNDNGQFVLIIDCNRRKIITDEYGQEFEVDPTNNAGIFTEFNGMFYCSYGDGVLEAAGYDEINGGKFEGHTFHSQRWKIKIPQYHPDDNFETNSFNYIIGSSNSIEGLSSCKSHNKYTTAPYEQYNETWRKQNYKFEASQFYSVAKYHPLYRMDNSENIYKDDTTFTQFYDNTGLILVSGVSGGTLNERNNEMQFPATYLGVNGYSGGVDYINRYGDGDLYSHTGKTFGAEWINFSLYFPQFTFYFRKNTNSVPHSCYNPVYPDSAYGYTMYSDNDNILIGNVKGTGKYLRNDIHKTTFIRVAKEDIIKMRDNTIAGLSPKGWRTGEYPYVNDDVFVGNKYMGKTNIKHFYKGIEPADCILRMSNLGII